MAVFYNILNFHKCFKASLTLSLFKVWVFTNSLTHLGLDLAYYLNAQPKCKNKSLFDKVKELDKSVFDVMMEKFAETKTKLQGK